MSSDPKPKPIEKVLFEEIHKEFQNVAISQGSSDFKIPFYMSTTISMKNRIAWIMFNLKLWEKEINWESDWSSKTKISICSDLAMLHCQGIVMQIQQQNTTLYKKLIKLEHKMQELDDAIQEADKEKRNKTVNIISDLVLAHAKFFIGTGIALVTMNPVPAYLTAAVAFSDVASALKEVLSIPDVDDRIKKYNNIKKGLMPKIQIAKAEIDRSIDEFLK